ncbi:MAG: L,D-transpeptidase [Nitrosomonas sp.]|nr:L,D-transpeptidase [Nitrosomonas sp.]
MLTQHTFIRRIILIGFLSLLFFHLPASANDIWIDVDTVKHTLTVMNGDEVEATFENVAIGRFGTTYFKMQGDDKTPLGKFRIGWINEQSRYYRFFGLDYPNRDTADIALEENRITEETWRTIVDATNAEKTPPQNTPLGGFIGIHGIGRGDPEIHDQFNWTNGCIALTNRQIDQLGQWLKPGIVVNIH